MQFTATPSTKLFYWTGCLPVNPDPGSQAPFLNTLFPYYDDLRTDVTAACPDCGIFTQTLGAVPNRQFVIRWKAAYFNIAGTAEFEVLLTEGSNTLSTIYGANANNGATAVSGIQKNLNLFTQFSCTTATLTSGLRVNYIPTICATPTPTPTITPSPTPSPTASPSATPTPCQVTYTTASAAGAITAGGTDIGNHCDDCATQVNLPFPVSVYGNAPISVATVGSNGDMQFTATPSTKLFYWTGCLPVNPDPGSQAPF
ncbi:MAG: hypothetical protein DMF06_08070, partial [Verrucomicrobia bacterium]